MPNALIKKYAQQTGTTISHVEKIWDHAKESAISKFKTESPKYWAYVNGIVRKALKLSEEKTTFKNHILMELFDSKIDYKIVKESEREFHTRATIEGRDILFTASISDYILDHEGIVTCEEAYVEFAEVKKPKTYYDKQMKYDLTGSGGEMKVFSMVGASLKELVYLYNPRIIKFSAQKGKNDSEKRADLYEKLIKKFITEYEIDRRDKGDHINFDLYRKP